jgi:hypothetical protein
MSRLNRLVQRKVHQIEPIRRFAPGACLLDIGPAYGVFAHLAKQSGFEVETIEIDERCCRYLRDVIGVGATQSDDTATVLPQLPLQQVIALWHIIEHLSDPWLCLQRAAERLGPGGILVIAAPNPQSLQFRIFRSRWYHLDAPRHLQLIPGWLLVRRLAERSLQPVMINSNDKEARALNVSGWQRSMMNLAARLPVRLAAWGVGLPVGRLARLIELRDLRGSAYTLYFARLATELIQPDMPYWGCPPG